ncbi:MAG TPA: zf-HC2 domain-containing protein [Verrucomicrobiae bacterium]|nr:zf-HC2 domain-containing protein [Verrucomicrobiae bacterium]
MTWTCDQIETQLSDYLEGLLAAPERAEFEAHVHSCAECAPLVESVRGLMTDLHAMGEVEMPPQMIRSILDQTVGPRERVSGWEAFRKFLAGFATPKFAYGVASVVATFVILLTASGTSLRKAKLADLQPANVYRNTNRQLHLVYSNSVRYVSDLRVVYEIQSRLRQDQNELQVTPDDSAPKSAPEKDPDHTGVQPKQQNRANELSREVEMLAAEGPLMLQRSIR